MTEPLFALGKIVATPGAIELLGHEDMHLSADLLIRHVTGDWGDLDDEDKATNNAAVIEGNRIMSSYKVGDGKIWIITEWDRSVTTLLLPDEY